MNEQEELRLSDIIDTVTLSFIKDPVKKDVHYLIKGKHYISKKLWEVATDNIDEIYKHIKRLDTEFKKI